MAWLRVCALAGLMLSVSAASASAGTVQRPEITDAGGDVAYVVPLPVPPPVPPLPPPSPEADALDLLAVWLHNETATAIQVSFQVTDLAAISQPGVMLPTYNAQYGLVFTIPGHANRFQVGALNAGLLYDGSRPTGGWSYGMYDDHEKWSFINGTVNVDAGIITVTTPKERLGEPPPGTSIGNLSAQAWGDLARDLQANDFAPAAEGTTYTLGVVPMITPTSPAPPGPASKASGLAIIVVVAALLAFTRLRRDA